MAEQTQDKRTASQKIDDLENAIRGMYQMADNMAKDLMILKDAVKLLGNKLQSVVQLLGTGSAITDESISQKMIENNVSELREKVEKLVSDGVLEASNEVTDNSFIVGRELSEDGNVVNPRLQFALSALGDDLRAKIKAGKIGDVITLQEGKLKFELLEVYSIQTPKAPANTVETESSSNEAPVQQ